MTPSEQISKTRAWVLASRPKTLPAAVSPVLVGTAAAYTDGGFRALPALAAFAAALLLQIGVNLANDYFDFKKGIDTSERLGPVRVTQSGLIAPGTVLAAMIGVLLLAALIGVYLIFVSGWPILAVGVASLIAALAYSGGPFPLASHGLGDLFVFIFFGVVAVCGTYYVQTLQLTRETAILAAVVGFLITAIIVVNNLRDIQTDAKVGKKTLAVILGERGTRVEFLLLLVGAYTIPIILWVIGLVSHWLLLPILSTPLAFSLVRYLDDHTGADLNWALAGTARLSLIFSILLSIGLFFSTGRP